MSDTDPDRAERLSAELESAFRNRADLYRLLLEELEGAFGREEAERILVRTVERRGREVGLAAYAKFGPTDAREIGEAFLAASPDGGRMYPTEVTRLDDGIAFQVTRCPLKDAWVEAGVNDADLATLCRIAGAFDRGLFESAGIAFRNVTWTPGKTGCCYIALRNGPPK